MLSPPTCRLHEMKQLRKLANVKTLGVIIDDKLLWKDHINEVCAKVSKALGIMIRVKMFVT